MYIYIYTYTYGGCWAFFRASIISIVGSLFLTSGALNISRDWEGFCNLICVASRRKLGPTESLMMLMLALGGLLGP